MSLNIKWLFIQAFVGVLVMPFPNSLWAMRGSINAGQSEQTLAVVLFPMLESKNNNPARRLRLWANPLRMFGRSLQRLRRCRPIWRE